MTSCSQIEKSSQSKSLLCDKCDIVEQDMSDSEIVLWEDKISFDVQSWYVFSFWILQCWQKNKSHIVNSSEIRIDAESMKAWSDKMKCCSLSYKTLKDTLWLSKILRHWQSVNVYLDTFSDKWILSFFNRPGGSCKWCRSESQNWTDTQILKNIKHSCCHEWESWQSESWRQWRVMKLTSSYDQSSSSNHWDCRSMSSWKKMRTKRNLTWKDHFSSSDHNTEKTWF